MESVTSSPRPIPIALRLSGRRRAGSPLRNRRGWQRAVLLDDIVGRAGTKYKVLQLVGDKLVIKDLLVVLHPGFARGYLQDLEMWQARTKINLYWLTDWITITEAMGDFGAMPKEAAAIMVEYLKDADDWQTNKTKQQKFLNYREKSGLNFGEPLA